MGGIYAPLRHAQAKVALAHGRGRLHFRIMIRLLLVATVPIACVALSGVASADLRDDIFRCSQIGDDGKRLSCFDAIDLPEQGAAPSNLTDQDRREMLAALDREFRFSPQLRTGELSFRLNISGELKISRDTAVTREVERLVRRIDKAFAGKNGWGIAISVHGGNVMLSRGTPYSGEELAQQAKSGLARSGLSEDRYEITVGEPAEPSLWDDGRIRDANEHLDVVITGL